MSSPSANTENSLAALHEYMHVSECVKQLLSWTCGIALSLASPVIDNRKSALHVMGA